MIEIKVDLNNKESFYSEFNEDKLSNNLNDYIINECYGESTKEDISINIYYNFKISKIEEDKMINVLKNNFQMQIDDEKYYLEHEKVIELLLFSLGILFLILYYALFRYIEIFSEIILIMGWLAIWESTYTFIFSSFQKEIKIKKLKNIVNANIKFIKK